jgi:predicted metal-binding membrane protein
MLPSLLPAAPLLAAVSARAVTGDTVRQTDFVARGFITRVGGFSMPDSKGVWAGSALKLERGPHAPWTHGALARAIPFR